MEAGKINKIFDVTDDYVKQIRDKYTQIEMNLEDEPHSHWIVYGLDEGGIKHQLACFSADTIRLRNKTQEEALRLSERFANTFIETYVKNRGIEKALKAYRIIPLSFVKEGEGLKKLMGLTKEEALKLREHLTSAEDIDNLDLEDLPPDVREIAEKMMNKLGESMRPKELPKTREIEEKVDINNNRVFYIKGTDIPHREDGPALISKKGDEAWFFEGAFHREEGPAVKTSTGEVSYWYRGTPHRLDGPAIVENGEEKYVIYGLEVTKEYLEDCKEQGLTLTITDEAVAWLKDGLPHNERGFSMFNETAKYWTWKSLLHRMDGPAVQYNDGKEGYFIYGISFTKDDYDYLIEEINEGNLRVEIESRSGNIGDKDYIYRICFYDRDDRLHSEKTPAIIHSDGGYVWKKHGVKHREEGPATLTLGGDIEYWVDGRLHRKDGPAIEYEDGEVEFYLNGVLLSKDDYEEAIDYDLRVISPSPNTVYFKNKNGLFHRVEGPAVKLKNEERWYYNGFLHREDGPALNEYGGRKGYYLNGQEISKEQFDFWNALGESALINRRRLIMDKDSVFRWEIGQESEDVFDFDDFTPEQREQICRDAADNALAKAASILNGKKEEELKEKAMEDLRKIVSTRMDDLRKAVKPYRDRIEEEKTEDEPMYEEAEDDEEMEDYEIMGSGDETETEAVDVEPEEEEIGLLPTLAGAMAIAFAGAAVKKKRIEQEKVKTQQEAVGA